MARTGGIAALRRLVALGRAAEAHGVDLEDAAEHGASAADSDEGLSRRHLLAAGALAAAAASPLGRTILGGRPTPPPRTQPTVAIVGAGLSGLSAAIALRDAGFTDVTVYDAGTRVGGRTFTRRGDGFFEAGQWAEWGGEFVDSGHTAMLALARRYGVATIDAHAVTTRGSDDTLYVGGRWYPWDEMVRDWKASRAQQALDRQVKTLPPFPWPYTATWSPAALDISRLTVAGWIDATIPGGRASRLGSFLDVAYTGEFGEDTDRQSALDLIGLLGFPANNGAANWWVYGASDERFTLAGGNQQLAQAEAAELGADRVALGHRLVATRRDTAGRAVLTFAVGSGTTTVTADRAVLAVPLGVLKALKADGAFAGSGFETDARRMGAIDALGVGANGKLHLQIADRFWTRPGTWGNGTGESYADTGYQEAWAARGLPGTTGLLVDYLGGTAARRLAPPVPFLDSRDPDAARRAVVTGAATDVLRQIEPVFPGMTARATGLAQLAVWHANPLTRGAYSYYTPGYCERFCTIEGVPARPFHFAGEHCSQEFQGFMEGAVREGQRAAQEIVADYR